MPIPTGGTQIGHGVVTPAFARRAGVLQRAAELLGVSRRTLVSVQMRRLRQSSSTSPAVIMVSNSTSGMMVCSSWSW